jgi:hypothetical protein
MTFAVPFFLLPHHDQAGGITGLKDYGSFSQTLEIGGSDPIVAPKESQKSLSQ